MPLYKELADPAAFAEEAALWAGVRPLVEALVRAAADTPVYRRIVEAAPWSAPLLSREIERLRRVPPPGEWVAYDHCEGRGKRLGRSCARCGGGGYLLYR